MLQFRLQTIKAVKNDLIDRIYLTNCSCNWHFFQAKRILRHILA